MSKVCTKMVPKELTEEQKQRSVTNCQDFLERQDDILGHFITSDETWVYQYDPETKWQIARWKTVNSPRPKKFHQSKSRVKTMLLTFFDIRGIVHYEFVPTGQSTKFTIWKYWKSCMKKLDGNDLNFCQQLMVLHHDNASAHMALSVRQFVAAKQITVLELPAYSPDLAPNYFFLFPKMKEILKGRHFNNTDDISINTMAALNTIPHNQFQNFF